MRVLLTGASGFLGHYILQALYDSSSQVTTIGRNASNHFQVDLTQEVPRLTGTFDLVVHAMGKAHSLPKNALEEKGFYDVNLKGTTHLCEGLNGHIGINTKMVFISSVAVYGLSEGEDIHESHPVAPVSAYAKSKCMAENVLAEWCQLHKVPLTILRLPLIVGKNAPGNLQDMISAIRRGFYLSVSGKAGRKSMVLASDVAAFIPRVAGQSGIFNLTDGAHPTMEQLAESLAFAMKKRRPYKMPASIIALAARMGDLSGGLLPISTARYQKLIATLTFSSQKAVDQLGWSPTPVLEAIHRGEVAGP